MNRRYKKVQRLSKTKQTIFSHIENNLKEYLIVSLIFFIGIIIGVVFINKLGDEQKEEIINYILSFITDLKDNTYVNEIALLFSSMKKNILLVIFLWFMGSTVIGISVVYLTICFRGFCIGYTISSIIISIRNTEREFYFYFQLCYYKIFYLYHA